MYQREYVQQYSSTVGVSQQQWLGSASLQQQYIIIQPSGVLHTSYYMCCVDLYQKSIVVIVGCSRLLAIGSIVTMVQA